MPGYDTTITGAVRNDRRDRGGSIHMHVRRPTDDAATGADFAVYDTVEDKTTKPAGFSYLRAFAVAVEDKSFVPSGNLVGAFIMTHAYHHSGNDQSLQPYAVRRVTISHATGSDPGVAVTEIYPAVAVAGMPARFGSAGVWYDDKILVHGGFHVDGAHALVATSCVENPTDAVWAFDMNTFQWSAPGRETERDGTFCASDPGTGREKVAAAVLNADCAPSTVDGTAPPDPTLRISGGTPRSRTEFQRTPATRRTSHPTSGASTSSPKRGRSSTRALRPERGTRQPRADHSLIARRIDGGDGWAMPDTSDGRISSWRSRSDRTRRRRSSPT